jgi:hypothetical protein
VIFCFRLFRTDKSTPTSRTVSSACGEIDKLEIRDTTGGSVSATLAVRVPASELESGFVLQLVTLWVTARSGDKHFRLLSQ